MNLIHNSIELDETTKTLMFPTYKVDAKIAKTLTKLYSSKCGFLVQNVQTAVYLLFFKVLFIAFYIFRLYVIGIGGYFSYSNIL